jgi:hypothetical protein
MRLAFLLALTPLPALADACTERLADLLTRDFTLGQPVRIHNLTDIGGDISESEILWKGYDHSLTTAIRPERPPTLNYQGAMYFGDGNGGWMKVADNDWQALRDTAQAGKEASAKAIVSATCSEAHLDGTAVDLVAGEVTAPPPAAGTVTHSFWVDRTTGFTPRVEFVNATGAVPVTVTSTMTQEPGLEIPLPE